MLIVDRDAEARSHTVQSLSEHGFEAEGVGSATGAAALLEKESFGPIFGEKKDEELVYDEH